jgi:hypothetical protein
MSVRDEIEDLKNQVMSLRTLVRAQSECIADHKARHNDLVAIVQALIETTQRINAELSILRNETHGDER